MLSKHKLSEEVAARYTCTQEPTRVRLPRPFDREMDLRLLTLEEADWLYATGLGILELRKAKKVKTRLKELLDRRAAP